MSIVFKTIPQDDQTVTPFKVYKSWEYTGTSATRFKDLYSASIFLGTAIKPDPSNYTGQLMSLDFDRESDTNDASRLLNTHLQNTPAGMLWYSLKHKYFNDYNDFISFAGNAEPLNLNTNSTEWEGLTFTATTASLNKSYNFIEDKTNPSSSYRLPSLASVISIPQIKFGEEIQPGSFELIVTGAYSDSTNNPLNTINYKLIDDGKGNLIDVNANPIVSKQNQILYLGFNESKYENISKNNQADPRYPTSIDYYNVTVNNTFIFAQVSGSVYVTYGLAGYFNNSYIRIDGTPSYFNPNVEDNFTISFFIQLADTIEKQYLITKRGLTRDYGLIARDGRRSAGNIWNLNENIYPYNIYVENNTIYAETSDGTSKISLSAPIFDGEPYHVAFVKDGNAYLLYLNGNLEAGPDNSTFSSITNKSDIFIGSFATQDGNLNSTNNPIINNGMMDEIQIFNKALSETEIGYLSDTNIFTSNIPNYAAGKIFYKEGIAVINNINPRYGFLSNAAGYNSPYLTTLPFASTLYNNSTNTINHNYAGAGTSTTSFKNLNTSGSVKNITVKWNSTVTIYENEILCRIREDEFNVTLNPTILKSQENSYIPQDYVYDDEFTPYITTIGLYNDKAELLAVGKLANPIKKRPDVDLNIVIKFDQ